ncbi:unnamed protein product [Rotaria sp. Silwood2]|nr:unnamed protein product [Rotaria sp. Silwood2]CAF2464956.1 unnamed protein product [Rotaria sp. Silwood2]CAF2700566.1 unnamed protein product [Rotaria sp. Silwood2]CAF2854081.1 unnamed protein product [Rotaria sp. Silwood2]CAF3858642.1 unnamed protein product [Rotaria sp. Silwood2]
MIETPQETIMMINEEQRFALHSITNSKKLSFDRYAYSRYKYGDSNLAKQFGQELCTGFLEKYHDFLLTSNQQFMAISSPRGIIPPAAYYIFQTFLEKLNRFLQLNGRPPALEHTIQRLSTIPEDYSLLSRRERFDRLVDERYSIDSQPVMNKFLLFIDDIRITGMHEMNIIRLLETSQIYNSRLFIYYAQLINDQVPSSFEHELNRCAIDNLEKLLAIIHNPLSSFQINTRVLKEILRSNLSELDHFLNSISIDLISKLYYSSLACNYQTIETFTDSLNYMNRCLQQRQNIDNIKQLE